MTNKNPYIPFPSKIKEVIKHTDKEYTFRMEFAGDVKPGQFFEVSIPKYGEAPISVSGIGEDFVDLTIRRVGRVTNEVFERYVGDSLLMRGPYGNGFDTSLYEEGEVVVVAGGTGVSPVRGVIDALTDTAEPKDKHVIVGFKSPDDMLFRDDLERWNEKLDLILTVDGAPEGYKSKGRCGRTADHDDICSAGSARERLQRREYLGIPGAQDVLRTRQVRTLSHRREVCLPRRTGFQLYRKQKHDRLG